MTFPESLIDSFDPPGGLTITVQKFRPVGGDRQEWVVAITLELPNDNSTFVQTSIPFKKLPQAASQEEVGIEAARRVKDQIIDWTKAHKDAEPIEGNSYTT